MVWGKTSPAMLEEKELSTRVAENAAGMWNALCFLLEALGTPLPSSFKLLIGLFFVVVGLSLSFPCWSSVRVHSAPTGCHIPSYGYHEFLKTSIWSSHVGSYISELGTVPHLKFCLCFQPLWVFLLLYLSDARMITWAIWMDHEDDLSILRSVTFITPAKKGLLACKMTYSQALEIRVWTFLQATNRRTTDDPKYEMLTQAMVLQFTMTIRDWEAMEGSEQCPGQRFLITFQFSPAIKT